MYCILVSFILLRYCTNELCFSLSCCLGILYCIYYATLCVHVTLRLAKQKCDRFLILNVINFLATYSPSLGSANIYILYIKLTRIFVATGGGHEGAGDPILLGQVVGFAQIRREIWGGVGRMIEKNTGT